MLNKQALDKRMFWSIQRHYQGFYIKRLIITTRFIMEWQQPGVVHSDGQRFRSCVTFHISSRTSAAV